MADAGFDVWLGNNRGNGYSMNNTRYNSSQPQFWDFSWDDMASSDLPANIDYILGVTGAKQLSYIGHSEGTIQAFAGFLNPTVAAKVNIFVALAPVAWVGNVEVKLLQVMADLDTDLLFEILGFACTTAAKVFAPLYSLELVLIIFCIFFFADFTNSTFLMRLTILSPACVISSPSTYSFMLLA